MPAPHVLRPATPVLRRGPGELQYGTDPRWAVRFVGLDEAEESWLRALARPGGARTESDALPASRREALVRLLDDARLLVPSNGPRTPSPAPGGGEAEVAVLSALRADGSAHDVLAARARAVVGVVGLGRVGASVATALATAGVGTLSLHDAAPVLVTDVGLGGYRLRDVGTPRRTALARVLAEISPDVSTGHVPGARAEGTVVPDVVVVVEHRVADASRVRELVGDGVAHLSVVVREADVLVGPLVRPGIGPCLRCLDLHRSDADPCWPQLARQLREPTTPEHEESVVAAAAAALAAGQVLAVLDGATPRTAAACLEIRAPDAVPRLREVVRHPQCGCGELSRTVPDGTPLDGPARTSGRGRG